MTTHTCDTFTDSEWAAFWRSEEKHIMTSREPTIFTNTIRKHIWRDQYSNHIWNRQLELAPAGTIKVHTFEAGVSNEPPAEKLQARRTRLEAMAKAIEVYDPFQRRALELVP